MRKETTQTRRRALQTLGSAALVGLAGCNASEPTESDQPSTDTQTRSDTPESTTTDEHTHDSTSSEQETPGPPDSAQFLENPKEVHSTLVEATSVGSDEVMIGLRLEDSSLPFTTEVYHAPEDAEVHTTKTYDTQDLSQVELVPETKETLETVDTDQEDVHYGTTAVGEPLKVTLVARHDGETFDWSAWERTGYPYGGGDEEDHPLNVACYCGGMIYTAPSGGTWARVIQITPTERVDPGKTIVLNWTSSRLKA